MSDLRVHHLSCAHLKNDKMGGVQFVCHVLLIENAELRSGLG